MLVLSLMRAVSLRRLSLVQKSSISCRNIVRSPSTVDGLACGNDQKLTIQKRSGPRPLSITSRLFSDTKSIVNSRSLSNTWSLVNTWSFVNTRSFSDARSLFDARCLLAQSLSRTKLLSLRWKYCMLARYRRWACLWERSKIDDPKSKWSHLS